MRSQSFSKAATLFELRLFWTLFSGVPLKRLLNNPVPLCLHPIGSRKFKIAINSAGACSCSAEVETQQCKPSWLCTIANRSSLSPTIPQYKRSVEVVFLTIMCVMPNSQLQKTGARGLLLSLVDRPASELER